MQRVFVLVCSRLKSLNFKNMTKKLLINMLALLLPYLCGAQQAAQYSLYMLNPFGHNPAYAGLDDESLSASLSFRKQWSGLAGSPQGQLLGVHLPVPYLGGGLGMNFENDALGAEVNLRATLAYSYWKRLGKESVLAVGAAGGVLQKTLDGSRLRTPDGLYEGTTIAHNDPELLEAKMTGRSPVLDVGAYFKGKRVEIGASVANLISDKRAFFSENAAGFSLMPNYFFSFAHNFDIGDSWNITSGGLAKSDGRQLQTDVSVMVAYNDNIFFGLSFRGYNANTRDALALMGGVKISETLRLAYAYDIGLSGLAYLSGGSHEIALRYRSSRPIGNGRPEKIIFTPRFL
jgi:type IX secretion system PorP/SprF family membrane protein